MPLPRATFGRFWRLLTPCSGVIHSGGPKTMPSERREEVPVGEVVYRTGHVERSEVQPFRGLLRIERSGPRYRVGAP